MPHAHGSAAATNRGRLVAVFLLTLAILVVEVDRRHRVQQPRAPRRRRPHAHRRRGRRDGARSRSGSPDARRPSDGPSATCRVEILAAVINAFLLFGVAAFILYEAWRRLSEPPEIASGLMLAVALVGLAANARLAAPAARRPAREPQHARAPTSRSWATSSGSVAVIVAAVVIALTGWVQADAVASALIGLLILPRTFALLRDATDVLLEATPKGVDMDQVRAHILDAPGVVDCPRPPRLDDHVSGMNVVSAHVVLGPRGGPGGDARRTSCDVPVGRLRHRALDLPARDARARRLGGSAEQASRATHTRPRPRSSPVPCASST